MSLSPAVLERITTIFKEVYPFSRDATIYAEVVSGQSQIKGITELRDALEHLNRAITTEDEECALDNLTEAYEHLRRAGIESVQRAATKLYWECLEAIKTPSIIYKLAFLEVPDNNRIRELRMNAMRKIADGRMHKSDRNTWIQSIHEFTEAIEYCFELKDMIPSKKDAKFRILGLVFGIITTLSLILNAYLIYKK
ncbi:MAG: hypothetical protein MUO26_14760 [Methanotrichaceae archaeon]|nr:hypothetical protein [Methanotrichaceae archaeon]